MRDREINCTVKIMREKRRKNALRGKIVLEDERRST